MNYVEIRINKYSNKEKNKKKRKITNQHQKKKYKSSKTRPLSNQNFIFITKYLHTNKTFITISISKQHIYRS